MKKLSMWRFIRRSLPVIIALTSFTILFISALSYSNNKKDSWEKDVKTRLFEILLTKKTKLEKALYSRIHYTRSVAAYVSLKPDISNGEFYNLADELINKDSVISTMALSKNCIIGAIYPLNGHEAAIGLNLLEHPERNEIVQKTISTQKTFVAGPVDLIEGGIAFISYTPIFDKTGDNQDKFWGVTDIVFYQNQLLEQANLQKYESGFSFALRGYNGLGNEGAVWWGDENVFSENPVTVDIDLPYGNWVLAAIPEIGWNSYLNQDRVLLTFLIVSSFIISLLIWLFSRAIAKIKRNEQELNAIFKSMDSLIVEFDSEGKYIKIPPVNADLLFKPEAELINKTVYEIFPEKEAKLFHHAIQECLESKKIIEIEYQLLIRGKIIWFSAKVSRKSDNRVIMHAIDMTVQKNALEKIQDSEKRLKALNATKDKFFSIIAHDLKSPFNSIIGFSEILVEQVHEKNLDGIEKYAGFILKSSNRAMALLMNLMEWAQSQTGRMEFKPEHFEIEAFINEAALLFDDIARQKSINIKKVLPPNVSVFADKAMLNTVFRNLISNAVKFTMPGGEITISAEVKQREIVFLVSDTGIGISKNSIEKIFRMEQGCSTPGTNMEKGTGLGLILCREFVEKHGGKIWVESQPDSPDRSYQDQEGIGSTFYFTIPSIA